MDKRKCKIQSLLRQIQEEKSSIKSNLDIIVEEIECRVDYDGEKKKVDLLGLLNYELQLLKKLTEINFDLESFIEEELPHKQELEDEEVDKKQIPAAEKSTKSLYPNKVESFEYFSSSLPTPPVLNSQTSTATISADYIPLNLPSTSTVLPSISFAECLKDNQTDLDISILKDNVKKFTEKLGLNEQIAHYKDFYEKKAGNNVDILLPEKDNSTSLCSVNIQEDKKSADVTLAVAVVQDEDGSTEYESISSLNTVQEDINFIDLNSPSSSHNDSDLANKPPTCLAKLAELNNKYTKPIVGQPSVPNQIKLKPSNNVIKNNLKKGKKNKNKRNCHKIYELTEKECPITGTMCAFSHIESPDEFYIHLVDDDCSLIDQIPDCIKQAVEANSTYRSKDEAYKELGMFCFVYLTNEKEWYRAEIINWFLDRKTNEVRVKLCDYGNTCIVDFKNLRRLNEKLSKIPKLAVKCHLPYMYPPDSTHTNRLSDWPHRTIDAITDISGLFKNVSEENKLFKIVYAQKIGDSVAIDLGNNFDCDDDKTVGQILLDLGLAIQLIDELDENNLEMERYLEDADQCGTATNINEAILGYDPRDEARICRFTKPDGTCYKGKNCKLEHVPFSRGGFTTDKIPCFKEALNDLILPPIGTTVQILITGYLNICNFYAQIITKPVLQKGNYVIDESLFHLLMSMNTPNVVTTYQKFKVCPAIGEICIVYHWTDKWLRGIIRWINLGKNDEPVSAEVFMLDFGDISTILLDNLRLIREDFLLLPFQAFHCYLYNFQEKDGINKDEKKSFFEEHILCKNFFATIMSSTLPLRVGITTHKNVDIGIAMCDKGYIEPRLVDYNPADGFLLD